MALAMQADIDNFAATMIGVRPQIGNVDCAGLRPNLYQNTQIVIKVFNAEKIEGRASGTSKFEFKLKYFKKKKHWVMAWKLYPGTSRDQAVELTDYYFGLLLNPPTGTHKRMPYGYSVFKLVPSKNMGDASKKNFKSALKSRYFHQPFVSWCKKHHVGCKSRIAKS